MADLFEFDEGYQWYMFDSALRNNYNTEQVQAFYDTAFNAQTTGTLSNTEMLDMITKAGFKVQYSDSGTATLTQGYPLTIGTVTPGYEVATSINSNSQSGAYTGSSSGSGTYTQPVNFTVDNNGKVTGAAPGSVSKTGSPVMTYIGEISSAAAAVSSGVSLGVSIDRLLDHTLWNDSVAKQLDPDLWDDLTYEVILPTIASKIPGAPSYADILPQDYFTSMFALKHDDNTGLDYAEQYIDERTLAFMAMYMRGLGFFDEGEEYIDSYDPSTAGALETNAFNPPIYYTEIDSVKVVPSGGNYFDTYVTPTPCKVFIGLMTTGIKYVTFASPTNFTLQRIEYRKSDGQQAAVNTYNPTIVNVNGNTYYLYATTYRSDYTLNTEPYIPINIVNGQNYSPAAMRDLFRYLEFGTVESESTRPEGVNIQEGATLPELDPDMTIEEVLQALQQQYPQIWDQSITNNYINPDGTVTTTTYVPVGTPEYVTDENGKVVTDEYGRPQYITGNQTQGNTQVNDNSNTYNYQYVYNTINNDNRQYSQSQEETDTTINVPPDTGEGDAPPAVIPSMSASRLWAIYNPTMAELNAFGSWLWSTDFVDQILKLFNDPMQAIIGLHMVYSPVTNGGRQNIVVGYLTSSASCLTVTEQYETIDCGSVQLPEYFGNVFDYEPYTKVQLYLPFIGVVHLDVADVMRSTIHITYGVDVLTGACLAMVEVTRDMFGGNLYTYAGNCSVQYPLSSGTYAGIIGGILGVAGSVAATIISGGAAAPVAVGAGASAIKAMHTDVSHSGSFSGNAGAMGPRKPYLIISRPQPEIPQSFAYDYGFPVNTSIMIGSASGFIRGKAMHISIPSATEVELNMIEDMLKEGIVV